MLVVVLGREFFYPRLIMFLTRVDRVVVEPVGAVWAAFSPLSGSTNLLNDLAAAVLEVLETGEMSAEAVYLALCQDSGNTLETIRAMVEPVLYTLVDAGLLHIWPTTLAS